MKIISLFRTCIAAVYSVILLTIVLALSLLTLQFFARPLWFYTARAWGSGCLWLMGVRLVEENEPSFKGAGARIIMFNHESVLDILLLCAVSPPSFSTVTKKLFMYIPIINLAFWASGQVFIDRKNKQKAILVIQKLVKKFKKNRRTLVISPEGTRTLTGELGAFKKGGFYMSIESKFPIHVLIIHNAYNVMPPGQIFPNFGTVQLRYLPPIETMDWRVESIHEHMEEVRNAMLTALEDMDKRYPKIESN